MRDHVKGGALTEVTFYILLALFTPRHGYAIAQFVEDATQGRLVLGAGTLYGALTALEQRGWIALAEQQGRKKEYVITPLGKDAARRELNRLRQLTMTAAKIMEEKA